MITLNETQIDKAAQDLYVAERSRIQINAISETHPEMTMDDAYAIQNAWTKLKEGDGDKVIGYKIGLTSRVMQRAMNIDTPDYGVLLKSMEFEDGSEIPASHFTDPKVEVELAFVLKDKLYGENISLMDVLNATDYVIPALELISARSYRVHPDTGYVRNVMDTISDNAANAGIIMGGRPIKPDEVDLRWCGAILYRNAIIEETGLAAAVLNHPANGISWIAKRFAPHGISLEKGQVLLSGSFTAPIAVKAGDTIHADYGALGNISCQFI